MSTGKYRKSAAARLFFLFTSTKCLIMVDIRMTRRGQFLGFDLMFFFFFSSAFQEADLVSSKDSGHGDSEQGDSDHDATNRGHSSGKSPVSQFLFHSKVI